MANLGVVSTLTDPTTTFSRTASPRLADRCARLTRAKVSRIPCDTEWLAETLARDSGPGSYDRPVFSMDGDIAPLVDLARLAMQNGLRLLADDAHGIVLGKTAGIVRASGVAWSRDDIMGTLGKARVSSCLLAGDGIDRDPDTAARTYIIPRGWPAVAEAVARQPRHGGGESWRREQLQALGGAISCRGAATRLDLTSSPTPIHAHARGARGVETSAFAGARHTGDSIRPHGAGRLGRCAFKFFAAHTAKQDQLLEALPSVSE